MKINFIILFFCFTNFVYSQINVGYDVFLKLNSNKKEMITKHFKITDTINSIWFYFSKKIPKEKQLYSLFIDRKGKLKKGSIANTKGEGSLVLNYFSSKNKKISILKLKPINVIDRNIINNTKFSNIKEILAKAKNIYVIDLAEEKSTIS